MKIDKLASVPIKWDTFEYPIKVGTPVSKYGLLANDATAYGLVVRTINRRPMEDGPVGVMTGGIIDMEEVLAGFGTALTNAAMTAMSGIRVFQSGFRVNPAEESTDVAAETSARVADVTTLLANVAENYSKKTYTAGDYCIHDKKLYKCKSNIGTAENWTASHWEQTTIMAELVALTTTEG